MKSLIIGMGEIGKAVREVIVSTDKVSMYDIKDRAGKVVDPVDVMHICFPYSRSFVDSVIEYKAKYQPRYTLIWSTVPIGTSKLVAAAHSPVEGKHPDLAKSIRLMMRWVGVNSPKDGVFFSEYFDELGSQYRIVENSDWTEALKLLSTAEYGINLVFADYKARVAEAIGMDYTLTQAWNIDYNELYDKLQLRRFQKYVLDPPGGFIGGHCVVPNAKILNEQYPNDLLDEIINLGG